MHVKQLRIYFPRSGTSHLILKCTRKGHVANKMYITEARNKVIKNQNIDKSR